MNAKALYDSARSAFDDWRFARAAGRSRRAATAAEADSDWDLAARAWVLLALAAVRLRDFDASQQARTSCAGALRRLDAKAPPIEANLVCAEGLALSYQDQPKQAEPLLREAIERYTQCSKGLEAADALRYLGVALTKLGRHQDAIETFHDAARRYSSLHEPGLAAYARGQSSMALASLDRHQDAVDVLSEAIDGLVDMGLPTYWQRYQRGLNWGKLRRYDQKRSDVVQAFEDLLRDARRKATPRQRPGWLRERRVIVDTYLSQCPQDDPEELHRRLQRAKVSVLSEHLALRQAGLELSIGDPELAETYRSLREQLDALDRHAPRPVPGRQAQRRELLCQLEEVEHQLEDHEGVTSLRPLDVDRIRAALPPGALLVDYALTRSGLSAVLITADSFRRVDLPQAGGWDEARPKVTEAARRVETMTSDARRALQRGDQDGAVWAFELSEVLEDLYRLFLGRFQTELERASELIVVPHGAAMDAIPWGLLRRKGKYLVEDLFVSTLPSIAMLAQPQPKPVDALSQVLFFSVGHDAANARIALSELPLEQFRNLILLHGNAANRDRIVREAGRVDVLHFAGHAAVEPGHPTMTHLAVGAGDRDPEWERLSVSDVLRLKLRPSLAVLSACSTGRTRPEDSETPLGLAHAFMAAGCSAVVSTLWPFRPEVSAALIPRFYEQLLGGQPPHRALNLAQRVLLAERSGLRASVGWGAFQGTFSRADRSTSRSLDPPKVTPCA